LASYDPNTKTLLDEIKREIAKKGIYVFLLDEVNVFITKLFFIIAERWIEEKVSIHIFNHNGEEIETFEKELNKEVDELIEELLKEKYEKIEFKKLSVIDKFETLARFAKVNLVIRDKEETRGGEIAELIYGLSKGYRFCLFKREGVEISSMLMEFLDKYNVNMRAYKDELINSIGRFVSYRVKEGERDQ